MAIRTLLVAFQAATEDASQNLRADRLQQVDTTAAAPPPFVQIADVLSVNATSGAVVQFGFTQVTARAANDEPLEAGMQVWVSQTDDGSYILHGSVKQ